MKLGDLSYGPPCSPGEAERPVAAAWSYCCFIHTSMKNCTARASSAGRSCFAINRAIQTLPFLFASSISTDQSAFGSRKSSADLLTVYYSIPIASQSFSSRSSIAPAIIFFAMLFRVLVLEHSVNDFRFSYLAPVSPCFWFQRRGVTAGTHCTDFDSTPSCSSSDDLPDIRTSPSSMFCFVDLLLPRIIR